DPRHWPFFGSVLDYLDQKSNGGRPRGDMPQNIALPWHFSSQRVGEVPRAGFYAAFLGGAYNPVWTEFDGKATKSMPKTLGETKNKEFLEPYLGITPESRFVLPGGGSGGPASDRPPCPSRRVARNWSR